MLFQKSQHGLYKIIRNMIKTSQQVKDNFNIKTKIYKIKHKTLESIHFKFLDQKNKSQNELVKL